MERSTEEASSSITSFRDTRTRSESVRTFIPASAVREHEGTSTRDPSSSTTQTRQTLAGRNGSSKQSVGVSISSLRHASRIVAPSKTRTGCPSTSSSTIRLGASSSVTTRPAEKTSRRWIADSTALDAV